jgi:glycosyltransferase involved in cell wall biosynthesis
MQTIKPRVTLLVPAYNEENRIELTLRDYLGSSVLNEICELKIVAVLNGCEDNTKGVVENVAKDFIGRLEIIEEKKKIGKGGALILGFSQSWDSDFVGFTDADNSILPDMFARLIITFIENSELDAVITSRYMKGANVYGKTFTRAVMSKVFSIIVNLFFFLGIYDTQCGAKLLKKSAVDIILPDLKIKNMAFDVNLLVSLRRRKLQIKEVPIDWKDNKDSSFKGRAHIVSLLMLWSLVRMRISLSPLQTMYKTLLMPLDKWLWVDKLGQNWEEF